MKLLNTNKTITKNKIDKKNGKNFHHISIKSTLNFRHFVLHAGQDQVLVRPVRTLGLQRRPDLQRPRVRLQGLFLVVETYRYFDGRRLQRVVCRSGWENNVIYESKFIVMHYIIVSH